MEIGESISAMLLARLAVTPEWYAEAACTQPEVDLDPLNPDDTDAFIALCATCRFRDAECRASFQDIHTNRRPIRIGVFHGKDYSAREE